MRTYKEPTTQPNDSKDERNRVFGCLLTTGGELEAVRPDRFITLIPKKKKITHRVPNPANSLFFIVVI